MKYILLFFVFFLSVSRLDGTSAYNFKRNRLHIEWDDNTDIFWDNNAPMVWG